MSKNVSEFYFLGAFTSRRMDLEEGVECTNFCLQSVAIDKATIVC